MDEGHTVCALGEVRQEIAHPLAGLTALPPRPRTLHTPTRATLEQLDLAAGIELPDIALGLEHHQAVAGRMLRHELARDIQLVDDTYNANPQSMRNALESIVRLKGDSRAIVVLGWRSIIKSFNFKVKGIGNRFLRSII